MRHHRRFLPLAESRAGSTPTRRENQSPIRREPPASEICRRLPEIVHLATTPSLAETQLPKIPLLPIRFRALRFSRARPPDRKARRIPTPFRLAATPVPRESKQIPAQASRGPAKISAHPTPSSQSHTLTSRAAIRAACQIPEFPRPAAT